MIFSEHLPVITGIGVTTPIGVTKVAFVNNLEKGESGLSYIDRFDIRPLPVKKAFLIREKTAYDDPANDRHIIYALHAAQEAIADSGLSASALHNTDVAVCVASSKGGVAGFSDLYENPGAENPTAFLQLFPHAPATALMKEFSLRGPSTSVVTACATGIHNIIRAAQLIYHGNASIALAGASDASITPLMLSGYHKMGVYSHDDMRPFGKHRSGFLIGEGAGILMLESEANARARQARIYARIRGYVTVQDTGSIVHCDPDAHVLSHAIQSLLDAAGLLPHHIDYVCLHGTSTGAGDAYEAQECSRAFGSSVSTIICNAPKSMLGHLLGASGAVETIVAALSMYNSTVYPTINIRSQDPACMLHLNRNRLTQKTIRYALKISMGFGGHIAVLLLEK